MQSDDSQEGANAQPGANRRGFIRGSSLILASAFPKTQKPQPLRIGLVGCDRRGTQLAARAIENGATLVALADSQTHRVQQTIRGLRSRAKSRVHEDQAVIALPSGTGGLLHSSCFQKLAAAQPDCVLFSGQLSESVPLALNCLREGIGCYLDDLAGLETRELREIAAVAEQVQGVWAAGSGTSYLPRFQSALAELQALRVKPEASTLGALQRLDLTIRVPANSRDGSRDVAACGWDKTQFVRAHAAGFELATSLFGAEPTAHECPAFVEYGNCCLESRIEFSFPRQAFPIQGSAAGSAEAHAGPKLSISYRAAESTQVSSAKAIVEFANAACDLQSGKIRNLGKRPVSYDRLEIPRVSPFAALDQTLQIVSAARQPRESALPCENALTSERALPSFRAAMLACELLENLS